MTSSKKINLSSFDGPMKAPSAPSTPSSPAPSSSSNKNRGGGGGSKSVGDDILARAQANTQASEAAAQAKQDAFNKTVEERQRSTGTGDFGRGGSRGVHEASKRDAALRVAAERSLHRDANRHAGSLRAGQRGTDGSRATSVSGVRPKAPTDAEIAQRMDDLRLKPSDSRRHDPREVYRQNRVEEDLQRTQRQSVQGPAPGTAEYYRQQLQEGKERERQFREGTTEFSIAKPPEVQGLDPFKNVEYLYDESGKVTSATVKPQSDIGFGAQGTVKIEERDGQQYAFYEPTPEEGSRFFGSTVTYGISPQQLQSIKFEAISELSRSGKSPTKQAADQKISELLDTRYAQGIPVAADPEYQREITNVNYAALKANQIVEGYNKGQGSAYGLSDYDVKVLNKYDQDANQVSGPFGAFRIPGMPATQAERIQQLPSLTKQQRLEQSQVRVETGAIPGPKPGQSEEAWLKELAAQGYQKVGTSAEGGATQYQFRNVKQEADDLLQAYQDAGYVKTNIKVGKATPTSDPLKQYTETISGKEITTVEVNLPSGEQTIYTLESKEQLRDSNRRLAAYEGGFGAGFSNVFVDLGKTVKFYTYDLGAEYIGSGGNVKKTQDLLAKGPQLNPSLVGDFINAPVGAGIDAAQGKGSFADLASENFGRYGAELTDPKNKDYYVGQATAEVVFGIATLGIAPAIKAVQAGLKTVPGIIKAGTEAARIAGVEGKITAAKPIIVTASKQKGIIEDTLQKGAFGILYGRGSINLGTKAAPAQVSFKVPKIPNAYELVSEIGRIEGGKPGKYVAESIETVGTYIPKTREFIPATGKLSRDEIQDLTGQILTGPRSLQLGKSLSPFEAKTPFQIGKEVGLDIAVGGVRPVERKTGETFAKIVTVLAQKPETVLPKISIPETAARTSRLSDAASRFLGGATGFTGRNKPIAAQDSVEEILRIGREEQLTTGKLLKQTGGYIEQTGEVLLPSGKRIGAQSQEIGSFVTFSEKELQRGLKEQAKLATSNKAARDALFEASGLESKAAKSKPSKSQVEQTTRSGSLETQMENEMRRSGLMSATVERLAALTETSEFSKAWGALSTTKFTGSLLHSADNVALADMAGTSGSASEETSAEPVIAVESATDTARIDAEIKAIDSQLKTEDNLFTKEILKEMRNELDTQRRLEKSTQRLREKELQLEQRADKIRSKKDKGISQADAQVLKDLGVLQREKRREKEQRDLESIAQTGAAGGIQATSAFSGYASRGAQGGFSGYANRPGTGGSGRKRSRSGYEDVYSFMRYPGEDFYARPTRKQLLASQQIGLDLEESMLSLGGIEIPGGLKTVSPPGFASSKSSRLRGGKSVDRGIGFDYGVGLVLSQYLMPEKVTGQSQVFDFKFDLPQGQSTRQQTKIRQEPFINEQMFRMPSLPRSFDFSIDIPTGRSGTKTRKGEREYELPDIYDLITTSVERKRLPGYGIDDYTTGLLESYGSYLGHGRKRRKR